MTAASLNIDGRRSLATLKLEDFKEGQGSPVLVTGQSSAISLIQEEYVEEEAQRDLDIVLTEAQQDELEVAYKINKHPDNETEAALAEKVELLPHEVKVCAQFWYYFQIEC
ncbi:predicted protein [Sclerotinia sclerotiorum 1980 UF-70]|uniref:Uncharacterized protein n=1 Tax=Sclerotinia sclerotiorum (strain ATCC 18683 / 1980 / Ss-1) TaxID=665079 RepID=A7E7P2_SCLS1|nr:predicted protein [Sclerotinia sclerotiorum 1980 UF-70]EDN96394.1 predicted protein [Sclerotinia sclerotiorum 1980 UF-70]